MFKPTLVILFLSQIVLAQTSDGNFLRKAVGRFQAVKGSEQDCNYGPYDVKFHSKKSMKDSFPGPACGAVLWKSSPSDPMGVFFCNVDGKAEEKTIGLNLFSENDEKPNFFISNAGKISNDTVQIVIPAEGNNPEIFTKPGTLSLKTTLTVTKIGIDVEDTRTLQNGQIETRKCQFQRISR